LHSLDSPESYRRKKSMSITGIIMAAVIVGGTGLFIGIFLGLADKKLTVKVDEKEEAILGVLPGNNCGGCGYPGCSGLAAAITKGEAPVDQCPVGGAPVAAKIGAIMGQEVKETARRVAFVKCAGTCDKTTVKYEYTGVEDCEMMAFIPGGGAKDCQEACKACGKCVAKCPRHLIELVPYDKQIRVACSSHAKGKAVTTACELGCIGCKKCEKNCPSEAITVTDFCAHIDYDKCTGCGKCKEVCPRHVIL
jgi:Na+-translocating ferredoxin:NAD+ oxidoreductase subunit B